MTGRRPHLGLDELLGSLRLRPTDELAWTAPNAPTGPGIVFGGQLLAQTIVAAARVAPGQRVKTVHTVFARAGSMDADVEIGAEPIHQGRTFSSATVTIGQGGRTCTQSLVLLTADEPDVIRHATPAPEVGPPSAATPAAHVVEGAWEVRVVDGVDIEDPDAVGPARLDVWSRVVGAPDDPVTAQALVAFASDSFLIGTAMRPHPGVGQALAHVAFSTGVVTHTITFHEPVDAAAWHLFSHSSPYAGHGRGYGRADVFTEEGALVASFVQDSMIRAMPSDGRTSR